MDRPDEGYRSDEGRGGVDVSIAMVTPTCKP